jgi:hypothetical protein
MRRGFLGKRQLRLSDLCEYQIPNVRGGAEVLRSRLQRLKMIRQHRSLDDGFDRFLSERLDTPDLA